MKALDKPTEIALWEKYESEPSVHHRNQLVLFYQPLISQHLRRVTRKHYNPQWSHYLDDCCQILNIELLEGISRFDRSRGVPFNAYIRPRLVGCIKDAFRTRVFDGGSGLLRTDRTEGVSYNLAYSLEDFATWSESDQRMSLDSFYFSHYYQDDSFTDDVNDYTYRDYITSGMERVDAFIMTLYYWEGLTMAEISHTVSCKESRISQRLKYLHQWLVRVGRVSPPVHVSKLDITLCNFDGSNRETVIKIKELSDNGYTVLTIAEKLQLTLREVSSTLKIMAGEKSLKNNLTCAKDVS